MKKLILISLLSFFSFNNIEAQGTATGKSENSFVEWNFGVAFIGDNILGNNFIFPGTSVLWGKTFINENNFIFEYEVGIALPSLITGKLGIGKKFNNSNVIVGVRPFPFNLFLQSNFTNGKKGYWITCVEFNPLYSDNSISFGSKAILNFGYRWNIIKNK
jgi:hypothetical protein